MSVTPFLALQQRSRAQLSMLPLGSWWPFPRLQSPQLLWASVVFPLSLHRQLERLMLFLVQLSLVWRYRFSVARKWCSATSQASMRIVSPRLEFC